jgi:hypothetical protein
MSSKDTIGSKSADRMDWSSAWEAVSRLAATRESLRAVDQPYHALLIEESANGQRAGQISDAASAKLKTPGDDEQLAGAVADIEKASAMLRRSEPALELGFPSAPARTEGRNYWPVWILIGAIWISATLVVASAGGAILYLLG